MKLSVRKKVEPSADEPVVENPFTAPLFERRGATVRRSARKARKGWYAPLAKPAPTTTRQAEILNSALIAAATSHEGLLIGRDCLSNSPVTHDVFTAYNAGRITSPNVVLVGSIGSGKSSLLKSCYVMRQVTLKDRRVVVFDKKPQITSTTRDGVTVRRDSGEYTGVTETLGGAHLWFSLDGTGKRINPLDSRILGPDGLAGQARLLKAMAELAGNGKELDEWEWSALQEAQRAVVEEFGWNQNQARPEFEKRNPVLEDLLRHLPNVHKRDSWQVEDRYSKDTLERVHQSAVAVEQRLGGLLRTELVGLFDDETSKDIDLSSRITSFDMSALPEEGPAVSLVMAIANVWMMGILRQKEQEGKGRLKTVSTTEEGWHLVDGPSGRLFRSNAKLSRAFGIANVVAIHHPADIPDDSPAIAIIKEAQTAHLFRQDREDDVHAAYRLFSLERGSQELLSTLATGHHLLKVSNNREIHVQHMRSNIEVSFSNTDEAMAELLT